MKAVNKTKVAVIGVGRMGQYHAGLYAQMPDVELVCVVDSDGVLAREVAERFGVGWHENYRDALGRVDLVSVATPTSTHYEIARAALESGLRGALVEKPLTDSLKSAEDLFALARRLGATLHVGHVERFNGAAIELRKRVKNPFLIEMKRVGPYDPRASDIGVILDLMIHDIDIALSLVDSELASVSAVGSSIYTDMEDIAHLQMVFANGAIASLTASRASQLKSRVMSVTQEGEHITLDFTSQEIVSRKRATERHEIDSDELKRSQASVEERIFAYRDNPLKLELRHFIDCSLGRSDSNLSADDELKSLRTALRALEELKLSRPTQLQSAAVSAR